MKSPRMLSLQSYTWKASFLFLVRTQNTVHGVAGTPAEPAAAGTWLYPVFFHSHQYFSCVAVGRSSWLL